MPAVAPTVAINGIPDGKQRDTADLSLDVTGGSYSRLTYSWSSNYGGTDQFSDATSATPTWTRPDTDYDRNISIKCAVTAHDDGDNTQAVRTDTEPTTILHVPNADAPSINVLYPPEDLEGTTYTLATEVGKTHAGIYDNLTYNWFVFHGDQDFADTVLDDRHAANPVWTRNRVTGRTLFQINCNLRAHGTNGSALKNTEEWTQSFVQPWVDDRPDADAPSLDYVQTTNTDPTTATDPGWFNGMVEGLEGTKFWARIRINETHGGLFDALSAEFTLVGSDDVDEEIQTWTWTRPDDTPSGGHPTVSAPFEFTRPMVNSDQRYKVTVFLTATGNDMEAERGTSEITDNDTGQGWVRNTPQATAPSLLIQHQDQLDGPFTTGIPNKTENDFVWLNATINGGVYDEIEYSWERVEFGAAAGTGTTDSIDPPDLEDPILTYPPVVTHHQYDVICTVTVRGNGTNVEDGSVDTVTDRRYFWSNPLPDADAPSVALPTIPTDEGGTTVKIVPTIGGTHVGLYDRLEYRWQVTQHGDTSGAEFADSALDDPTSVTPTLTRSNSRPGNTQWDIRLTLTAYGSDANANGGTSESTSAVTTVTIEPTPIAAVPDGVAIDAIPNGQEGSTAHLHIEVPAGTYDVVAYQWGWTQDGVSTGFGTTRTQNPLWHRPQVTADTEVTVTCQLVFQGLGFKARSGTIITHTSMVTTTITDTPPLPPPPPTIMEITDENGTSREITEIAVSEANGRGRSLSGLVVTTANGTAIEVWDGS